MRPLSYAGYRLPPEIIQHAIWLYLRFTLSFRDVEELLATRVFEDLFDLWCGRRNGGRIGKTKASTRGALLWALLPETRFNCNQFDRTQQRDRPGLTPEAVDECRQRRSLLAGQLEFGHRGM